MGGEALCSTLWLVASRLTSTDIGVREHHALYRKLHQRLDHWPGLVAGRGRARWAAGERGPLLQEHVTEANELLRGRAGHSVDLTENVLKEKPEPGRRLLFRADVLYECEDIGNGVQFEHLYELSDVLRVAGPRSERLHGEEMFG